MTRKGLVGCREGYALCDECLEEGSPRLGSVLALVSAAQTCVHLLDHVFATQPLAIIAEQLDQLRQVEEQARALRDRSRHDAEFDSETDAPINEKAHVHSNLAILIDDEIQPAISRLERLLTLLEASTPKGGK